MRTIEIPDQALVVLIGAAGAGKSTFANRHFAPDEILSSDAFRASIAGDAADQRATGAAFRRLHEALTRRLAIDRLTVVDATNLTTDARRALLARAAAAHRPAIAIVIDPPPGVIHARNAMRPDRTVPADVVDRHLRTLERLLASGRLRTEGFVAIHRLAGDDGLDDVAVIRRSIAQLDPADRPARR